MTHSFCPVQVSGCWPVVQSSCPGSPCWSRAACSSRPPISQMQEPTLVWPATPEALTRSLLTSWCGVSGSMKTFTHLGFFLPRLSKQSCRLFFSHRIDQKSPEMALRHRQELNCCWITVRAMSVRKRLKNKVMPCNHEAALNSSRYKSSLRTSSRCFLQEAIRKKKKKEVQNCSMSFQLKWVFPNAFVMFYSSIVPLREDILKAALSPLTFPFFSLPCHPQLVLELPPRRRTKVSSKEPRPSWPAESHTTPV